MRASERLFPKSTPATRLALAAVAAAIVFASVYAFAASAGVNQGDFGANSKLVTSCGSGMTFKYTTAFYSGIPGYAVNGIDVAAIPAGCLSKSLSVIFSNDAGSANGSPVNVILPASGASRSISINPSANTINAGQVSGVSIIVS